MASKVRISAVLLAVMLGLLGLLQGCGGSSGSTAGGSGDPVVASAGIELPTEVSAISASTTSGGASLASHIRAVAAAVSDLPADSDYKTTLTAKFVDEPTLEVFGIIETILKATAQTHYSDAANVGSGAYRAVVSWFDDEGGKSTKALEQWVVKSDMVDGVNQVKVWIDDPSDPAKVQVNITTAPTQNDDGSYLNYGEWTIMAVIGDGSGSDDGIFYAAAAIVDGNTQLSMSEDFTFTESMGGGGPIAITEQTRAVMIKSATSGYGKASIADFNYCWNTNGGPSPCTGPAVTLPTIDVQYAYNAATLALDPDGSSGIIYKDRTSPVEISYRYGMFDATSGQNVEKGKQFGFPVSFDSDGSHGYYGAWQGRHQLWAGGSSAPADGTSVTKEVWDDSVAPTYTTKTYNGSLTKRGLVAGDLAQIQDIPVEIWMSDNFDLKFDATAGGWKKCAWEMAGQDSYGFDLWQESCSASLFDLTILINSEDSRKHINIGRRTCQSYNPDTNCSDMQYDFMAGGYFEENQWSMNQPGTQYGSGDWADQDRLWVNVNGSTYIVFNGTAWVEKTLSGFDNQTWTPTFAEGGDIAFDFPADREYYINNKGANFVVRRIASNGDAGDYQVKMEVQSVVRPDNVATVLNGVSYFAVEWEDANNRSTFVFDETTMLLKYATVGSNDSSASVGDTLTRGSWGLVAFNTSDQKLKNSDNSSLQFNWEYATDQNPWGAITYLVDGNGDPVYLSDPIMLNPLALTPLGGGDPLNFSLQFDGWMHGLPDMRWELEKADYIMSDEIKNKVVNIPAGTEVVDSSTGGSYYIKPLEVGIILPILGAAPTGAPDPTAAASLDINFTVPTPTEIGDMPTGLVTKYVEGIAVQ